MKKRIFSIIKYIPLILLVHLISCKNTKTSNLSEKETKTKSDEIILFDFENGIDESAIVSEDATYKLSKTSNGNNKLEIATDFNLSKPGIILKEPQGANWDLSGYYSVKADVTNIGDKEMQVEFYVGDDPDGLVKWYCSDYVDLKPGESKTITVFLAWSPWAFDPQIEVNGMRGIPGKIKTDLKAIKQVSFNARYAVSKNKFSVDNIRAVQKLEFRNPKDFFPFVDKFGQYKHKEWQGKTHSDTELKKITKLEAEAIAANPGPKNRNKYGGWTAGPQLKATGFFRTEKYKNKWWMVDPDGRLFWTNGVNCVSSKAPTTGVQYRESYFDFLPKEGSTFSEFYSKSNWGDHGFYKDKKPYTAFNFYQANLHRKYGDKWLSEFQNLAHNRLRNWGLNTIGFVSDLEATQQHRTPFVGSVWILKTPKIAGSTGYWGPFHDVFDPEFKKIVNKSMQTQKNGAGDPWCIGFFVDNELSWGDVGSLAIGTLKSPAAQPAKIEFIKDLKSKYKNIDKLNAIWKTNHESWDALLNTTKVPKFEDAKEDLTTFYGKIADTYFKIIKEGLNTIAPKQNYLGCRFAWANNDIVLTAASKYMDIMSFNKYEYSVENIGLPEGVDAPIMIGEFDFGALDRGHFHYGVKLAKDQAERGTMYKSYIEGALRNPLIVGAHWFQYNDEPFTARGDGENYNVGFVDICDNPYTELIDKVRETSYKLYEYRSEN